MLLTPSKSDTQWLVCTNTYNHTAIQNIYRRLADDLLDMVLDFINWLNQLTKPFTPSKLCYYFFQFCIWMLLFTRNTDSRILQVSFAHKVFLFHLIFRESCLSLWWNMPHHFLYLISIELVLSNEICLKILRSPVCVVALMIATTKLILFSRSRYKI